ncbi:MAG: HD domain-containing protein [Acholeplasmatales bacterium]|nr:HD domain-containing protein [Acholeplasmatales bacterium]
MDFIKMKQYLKETLEKNDAILDKRHNLTFRNRYEHSLRVFKWVKRLSVDFDNFDYDVALTAALFHDIGYAHGHCDHNIGSSKIFLEYANENNFDKGFTEKVNYIILNHSDKKMLKSSKNIEFIVVLEADLLDEEGSLGIVWDLLAAGQKNAKSYLDAINEIKKHSIHILSQDYMVTPTAIKIWDEKKNLVKDFISQLYEDLFVEEDL